MLFFDDGADGIVVGVYAAGWEIRPIFAPSNGACVVLENAKEKALKPSGFKAFPVAGAGGLEVAFAAPLAVPEKIFGLPLFLDFFDRCANPCSLYPPQAALAGVARHAPRASGSLLLYKTRKTSAQAEAFLVWQGQKGSNPRHAVLETAALPTELCPYMYRPVFPNT